MILAVVFRPEAEEELVAARDWYEMQLAGLGDDFVAEVYEAIGRIAEYPQAGAVVYRAVRRQLVHRYPHVILYISGVDRVVVLAVYHGRRSPDGWRDRL